MSNRIRAATQEERQEFLDVVRSGAIHLDGFCFHRMTGLGTEGPIDLRAYGVVTPRLERQ